MAPRRGWHWANDLGVVWNSCPAISEGPGAMGQVGTEGESNVGREGQRKWTLPQEASTTAGGGPAVRWGERRSCRGSRRHPSRAISDALLSLQKPVPVN